VFAGAAFIGAAASAAAYGWRLRRRAGIPSPALTLLAQAQVTDGGRHRYRFFGGTPPTLVDVYVRRRIQRTGSGRVEAAAAVRVEEVLGAGGHVLLVGGPGAGKSAMVARTVADSALAVFDGRGGTLARSYAVAVHAADLIDQQLADAVAKRPASANRPWVSATKRETLAAANANHVRPGLIQCLGIDEYDDTSSLFLFVVGLEARLDNTSFGASLFKTKHLTLLPGACTFLDQLVAHASD
jgi:hypothetical protein